MPPTRSPRVVATGTAFIDAMVAARKAERRAAKGVRRHSRSRVTRYTRSSQSIRETCACEPGESQRDTRSGTTGPREPTRTSSGRCPYLKAAIDADLAYAAAYAGLADCYNQFATVAVGRVRRTKIAALPSRAQKKAIEIDLRTRRVQNSQPGVQNSRTAAVQC